MSGSSYEEGVRGGRMPRGTGWALVFAGSPPVVGAGLASLLIHLTYAWVPGPIERTLAVAVLVVGSVTALVPLAYLAARRRNVDPGRLALVAFAAVCTAAAGSFLFWASGQIGFPADILIWSESDFVNDILKFRVGYPLYTDQVNNDSFQYPPGPQLLTYFLAWIAGQESSVPAYRAIQLLVTLGATGAAVVCARWIARSLAPERFDRSAALWVALWTPLLFLVAVNSLTNPFVYKLHGDALAQLATVLAYLLLLVRTRNPGRGVLLLMVLAPSLGFLVKQSLVLWLPLYGLHLLLFDAHRSWRLALGYGAAAGALLVALLGACYALWGEPFFFWLFVPLGWHGVSLLRSGLHLLDAWIFAAAGILGGALLLRGPEAGRLLGPFFIWLLVFLSEVYTSGIAWMLNHIGPGSLLAAVWGCAALVTVWPVRPYPTASTGVPGWLRAAAAFAVGALVLSGLHAVRIPERGVPEDAYRYLADVERELERGELDRTLLDAGTWRYLHAGIVMKDRVPGIGDRGHGQTGDFSGILGRIADQSYEKILVRKLHAPDFWYDHSIWERSSGIREALLRHYREVRRIERVSMERGETPPYLFSEISVLVPRDADPRPSP